MTHFTWVSRVFSLVLIFCHRTQCRVPITFSCHVSAMFCLEQLPSLFLFFSDLDKFWEILVRCFCRLSRFAFCLMFFLSWLDWAYWFMKRIPEVKCLLSYRIKEIHDLFMTLLVMLTLSTLVKSCQVSYSNEHYMFFPFFVFIILSLSTSVIFFFFNICFLGGSCFSSFACPSGRWLLHSFFNLWQWQNI